MKRTNLHHRGDFLPALFYRVLAFLAIAGSMAIPRSSASVYVPDNRLWPDGVVPFVWDPAVPIANRLRVIAAMNIWKTVARVDFILRTDESDYVLIQNAPGDTGSRSPKIGRDGGKQDLFIRQNLSGITDHGLAHELGHVLGFYHTHQRADRDEFVTWYEERTIESKKGDFEIKPLSIGYPRDVMDYDSVMSYGRCIFAICDDCASNPDGCGVLSIKDPDDAAEFNTLMGQRSYLTPLDAMTMSFMYPPTGWRFVETGYVGSEESGTFHQPYLTLNHAITFSNINAIVWVQQGNYRVADGTLNKPMTFRAPLGGVLITSN